MKTLTIKVLSVFLLLLFAGFQTAQAQVTLDPAFEGTVMITTADGTVTVLSPGDAIPDIPSQSKIEVFDGKMKITTEDGDSIIGACGGNEASMNGGCTAEFSCGEEEGSVEVLEGSLTLRNLDGETLQVKSGSKQSLSINPAGEAPAPETAAGDEIGTPVDEGLPPVDSRSLETSPSA